MFLTEIHLKLSVIFLTICNIAPTTGQPGQGHTLTLEILERLNEKVSLISSEMGVFNKRLNSMEQEVSGIQALGNTVVGIEKSINRAFFEIQIQDDAVRTLKYQNITKLERENGLWKSNFRNINTVLTNIKRKLGIV